MDEYGEARTAVRSPEVGGRWTRFSLVTFFAGIVLIAAGCGSGTSDAAEQASAGASSAASVTEGDDQTVLNASDPLVVHANSSPTVMAGADVVHCIATADQTGGGYSFLEIQIPAGSGPPPHQHDSADEFFYILSGTASIQTGSVAADVGAGDYFHVPRGATHSIRAVTDVRLVAGYAPGGDEILLFGCPS